MSTNIVLENLKNQIQSNLMNLDARIRLNESIDLMKAKLNGKNEFDVKILNQTEIDDALQMMLKESRELLMKTINVNDELNEKENQTKLINQTITNLPSFLNEMIESFQDSDLLIKLSNDVERLNEEIIRFCTYLTMNNDRIRENFIKQNEQQMKKIKFEEQFQQLDTQKNELMIRLKNIESINKELNDELTVIENDHNRSQLILDDLKSKLKSMYQTNQVLRNELNDKLILFNELKHKKQCLLDGTFVDDETKKLKFEIDRMKDDLFEKRKQIDDIKIKSQSKSQQLIRIPKLKDENLFNQIKIQLTRLNDLIEFNYRDKYLVFDDNVTQSKPVD